MTPIGHLCIESCIVWVRLRGGQQGQFLLAHLFRHPRESHPKWRRAEIIEHGTKPEDLTFTSRRSFDHAPSTGEIDQFLADTEWKFKPEVDFSLVDAAVCVDAWKKVTGQRPTRVYQHQVAESNAGR